MKPSRTIMELDLEENSADGSRSAASDELADGATKLGALEAEFGGMAREFRGGAVGELLNSPIARILNSPIARILNSPIARILNSPIAQTLNSPSARLTRTGIAQHTGRQNAATDTLRTALTTSVAELQDGPASAVRRTAAVVSAGLSTTALPSNSALELTRRLSADLGMTRHIIGASKGIDSWIRRTTAWWDHLVASVIRTDEEGKTANGSDPQGETDEGATETSSICAVLRTMSLRFAQIVARDPSELDNLEWRDMERMLAEIFDAVGFTVTLTPSSKDGGKDVILQCLVNGVRRTYIVEIKHWRSSTRVGPRAITGFVEVVAREQRDGGLFLSTYGYSEGAFSFLSAVQRRTVRFGAKPKVVALCKTYTKTQSGIWAAPESLPGLLYEDTE